MGEKAFKAMIILAGSVFVIAISVVAILLSRKPYDTIGNPGSITMSKSDPQNRANISGDGARTQYFERRSFPEHTERAVPKAMPAVDTGPMTHSMEHSADIVFVVASKKNIPELTLEFRSELVNIAAFAREVFSKKLRSDNPDVSFGLVEYTDYEEGLYFNPTLKTVVRVIQLQNDLKRFIEDASKMAPPDKASEDNEEAVFDGIYAALKKISWRQRSARAIFVVGDDAPHQSGSPKNPYKISSDYLAQEASRIRVLIFTVRSLFPGRSDTQAVKMEFLRLTSATGGFDYHFSTKGDLLKSLQEGLGRIPVDF